VWTKCGVALRVTSGSEYNKINESKINLTLEQSTKVQRENKRIALLIL
jgi:hypothetical protein